MAVAPRRDGRPNTCSAAMNSSKSDKPMITSGTTKLAEIIPVNRNLPVNRPRRARANPANVPRTVAVVALIAAIERLSVAAVRI